MFSQHEIGHTPRRRRRTKPPAVDRGEKRGNHRHGSSHIPRLTRMYMSVPGSRGSDDRILIGGLIAAVLVLVVIGGWLMINSPRDDRVSSADHAQTASVRFLGMTERNGLAELRLEERGQEITLSLSSANPIVTQARTLKPGAWFQVPRSQVPLTDDNSKPIKPSETP